MEKFVRAYYKIIQGALLFFVFYFLLFPVGSVSAYLGLIIEQRVNKTVFQADSGENFVTYTARVTNDKKCDSPTDIAVIFDRSNSMKSRGENPPEPLTTSKTAVTAFVNNLNSEKDSLALVQYSNNAQLLTTLSRDYTEFKNALAGITTEMYTNIEEGLILGRNELQSSRKNPEAESILILFSDGGATHPDGDYDGAKIRADQQAQITKDAGIKIITIGLESSDSFKEGMARMASPGMFYWAPNPSDMAGIYETISHGIAGISPDTVVWDDVSDLLQYAEFVSADKGGYLDNNKVVWNLGDLKCGESVELNYTFKFKSSIHETIERKNTFHVTNSLNENATSNELTVKVIAPWLTISLTDNRETAENGDTIEYVIKLKNVGEGEANDVKAKFLIPEFVVFSDANFPYDQVNGREVLWTIPHMEPGEEFEFKVYGKLILPELYTIDKLNSYVTATNDNQTVDANDLTNIIYSATQKPDFSIFVNCIEINKSENSFTAHFGYVNRLNTDQQLDLSVMYPDSIPAETPKVFKPGKFDNVFSAKAPLSWTFWWKVQAGDVRKEINVNSSYTKCPGDEPEVPEPPVTPPVIPPVTPPVVIAPDPEPLPTPQPTPVPQPQPEPVVTADPDNVLSEFVKFNEQQITFEDICDGKQMSITNIKIESNGKIALVEYSIDNGINWFTVNEMNGLGTGSVTASIRTGELQNKLYGFKLRVKTLNGNQYSSEVLNHSFQCNKECGVLILGTYYRNGFGLGVLDKSGDFIYNSSLNNKLVVEILGGAERVYAKLAKTEEELQSDFKEIDLAYDYSTDLWSIELPKDYLQQNLTHVEIVALACDKADTKIIPSIINPDFTKESKPIYTEQSIENTEGERENYAYKLFFKDGVEWKELNYQNELNDIATNSSFQKFSLTPGEYYIESVYPNGDLYYTKKFNLEKPSVIRVLTTPNVAILPFLDRFFRQLDVEVYSESTIDTFTVAENVNVVETRKNGELYKDLYKDLLFEKPQNSQILAVYWNRWNPHFAEELAELTALKAELQSDNEIYRDLVILTDPQNIQELKRVLQINQSNIQAIEVTNIKFLDEEIKNQPEMVIYENLSQSLVRVRGKVNLNSSRDILREFKFVR